MASLALSFIWQALLTLTIDFTAFVENSHTVIRWIHQFHLSPFTYSYPHSCIENPLSKYLQGTTNLDLFPMGIS